MELGVHLEDIELGGDLEGVQVTPGANGREPSAGHWREVAGAYDGLFQLRLFERDNRIGGHRWFTEVGGAGGVPICCTAKGVLAGIAGGSSSARCSFRLFFVRATVRSGVQHYRYGEAVCGVEQG